MFETRYIWPYILKTEYACHHCHKFPPSFNQWDARDSESPFTVLFSSFERLRNRWGKNIIISSGYRCEIHNIESGGEPLSIHLFGLAFDLKFNSFEERDKFYKLALEKTPWLRIGIYKTKKIIHIDSGYMVFPKATEKWHRGARWKS